MIKVNEDMPSPLLHHILILWVLSAQSLWLAFLLIVLLIINYTLNASTLQTTSVFDYSWFIVFIIIIIFESFFIWQGHQITNKERMLHNKSAICSACRQFSMINIMFVSNPSIIHHHKITLKCSISLWLCKSNMQHVGFHIFIYFISCHIFYLNK